MKIAFLLAALVLPLPLSAQLGPSIGMGRGVLQTDDLMADAYHVQAGVQLARITDRVTVRGEALLQQGTANASPLSCEQARQVYCFGRTDEQRLFGAGAHVRFDLPEFVHGVHAYLTPVGVGAYYLRTDSHESEGPTGVCIRDGDLAACPDAPPFADFSRTTSTLSLGGSTGAGLEAQLGRMRVFAEFRAHVMLASMGETGSVPVTFGVSF
jgi:hypothetical protein